MKNAPAKRNVPQIAVTARCAPDTEKMLRALMVVFDVDRAEIERLLKDRRERIDHDEGLAA